jgi:TRAP-type mannitol/chloroaromatic compound transport system permease large subunit
MFCAAVPAAGAIGAKLNADQKKKLETGKTKTEKPIAVITSGVVVLLVIGSVVYHSTAYS